MQPCEVRAMEWVRLLKESPNTDACHHKGKEALFQ
jgi:hypothetical protein